MKIKNLGKQKKATKRRPLLLDDLSILPLFQGCPYHLLFNIFLFTLYWISSHCSSVIALSSPEESRLLNTLRLSATDRSICERNSSTLMSYDLTSRSVMACSCVAMVMRGRRRRKERCVNFCCFQLGVRLHGYPYYYYNKLVGSTAE